MEPHGKKKQLSNESTRFVSAARRTLFPKAFFALLCPSSLGWGTSSAQRQNGPSGYLMSITVFYIWRWVGTKPCGHTRLGWWDGARRNSCLNPSKGRHRGSFGSGAEISCRAQKPRENGSLDRHQWHRGAEKCTVTPQSSHWNDFVRDVHDICK